MDALQEGSGRAQHQCANTSNWRLEFRSLIPPSVPFRSGELKQELVIAHLLQAHKVCDNYHLCAKDIAAEYWAILCHPAKAAIKVRRLAMRISRRHRDMNAVKPIVGS